MLLFCWGRFVFRRSLMALRSGEINGSRVTLYRFCWPFVAEETICVVWLATYFVSASACRPMECSQVQCGLVVKRVCRQWEIRWLFGLFEVYILLNLLQF